MRQLPPSQGSSPPGRAMGSGVGPAAPVLHGDGPCPMPPSRDSTLGEGTMPACAEHWARLGDGGRCLGGDLLCRRRAEVLGSTVPTLGCCQVPLLSVTRVTNAVEGLHSPTGENESPRKGSAWQCHPGPSPRGAPHPLGSRTWTQESGLCKPPTLLLPEASWEQQWPWCRWPQCGGWWGCRAGAVQPLYLPSREGGAQGLAQLVTL